MIIKSLVVYGQFKYLWCKSVKDVDLYKHCAKCLIGEYHPKFNANLKELIEVELPHEITYVCGVSKPFSMKNNFHLAVRPKKGSMVIVERQGIHIVIQDAEELPINFDKEACNHPQKAFKSYVTCRNWQFAYLYQDLIKGRERA